jgi:threonine/homoserine/homoserine lactone efflux protein
VPKAALVSFGLGFVMAAPIGPMGLRCLRQALTRGERGCLVSALGISSAYAIWSFVAVRDLNGMVGWMNEECAVLQVAVGHFFLCSGVHGLVYPERGIKVTTTTGTIVSEFAATFLVVLANPSTLLMFSAVNRLPTLTPFGAQS